MCYGVKGFRLSEGPSMDLGDASMDLGDASMDLGDASMDLGDASTISELLSPA